MHCILKKIALSFSICIFLSFPLFSQTPSLAIDKGDRISFKFTLFNNLILLKGQVNNGDTLIFILDTGVKNCILFNKAIGNSIGLTYSHKVNLLGAGSDQIISALVVENAQLGLYGASGKIDNLLVLEEDYLQIRESFGTEVHGILGSDIFKSFVVKIDYANKSITFYSPGKYKQSRWFTRVPIEIINAKPYVNVQLNSTESIGFTTKLLFDLGASHSALFELGTHDSLSLPEKHVACNLGRGLGGEIPGYMARVNYLVFDKFYIEDAIVSYTKPYIHIKDSSDIQRHGTIGAEVFTRFTIVIDYFNGAIYLRKNSLFNKRFEYNMSGVELVSRGKNLKLYYISNIAKASPAELAGALVGDLIININGTNTAHYNLDELQHLFHSRNRRLIRIQAVRDGRIVAYKFRLKREI